jgi:hypothetical protein
MVLLFVKIVSVFSPAVYCIACYADLENICAVCENAVEMKGSDGSEEE